MLGVENRGVSCIACGADVERSDAREYDKFGDRWNRDGKEFEYLCKPCFQALTKHARDGLEDALVDCGAGRISDERFLERFLESTREGRAEFE